MNIRDLFSVSTAIVRRLVGGIEPATLRMNLVETGVAVHGCVGLSRTLPITTLPEKLLEKATLHYTPTHLGIQFAVNTPTSDLSLVPVHHAQATGWRLEYNKM
jgi:hypothetical protein